MSQESLKHECGAAQHRLASCIIIGMIVLAVLERPAVSQVVKINESALTPYKAPDSAGQQSGVPSAYLYVAVRPGPSGTLSRSDGTTDVTVPASTSLLAYPSLDFVISAASQLIAEGSSSNNAASASKALAEVLRINAHVRIESLDASRAPIAGGTEPASHKNSRAPTQIAYQSSDNEFGWTWYESADTPIEGLHRCAALLQVPLKAAYLHVSVDLITDWRHFGPWKKTFDFQVPVLPGPRKE